jgi:hypothetical protein
MFLPAILALVAVVPIPAPPRFPLRTDLPPKEWTADQINEGLPYRWEKGVVHLLASEVIEDDRPHKYTQILVIKRFDKPTEKGGYRWVLAHLYQRPEDKTWPWRGPMRIPGPLLPGERMPKLTDAQMFGHELFDDPPTDRQLKQFLGETRWTPKLGADVAWGGDGKRIRITKLTAGGVDRAGWRKVFGREPPVELFPELKKTVEDQK